MTTPLANDQQHEVQLPQQAIAALSRGRQIEAIRIVRQQTGLGLKDSKALVAAYAQQHPETNLTSASVGIAEGQSRPSMMLGILVIVLVTLILAWIFFQL